MSHHILSKILSGEAFSVKGRGTFRLIESVGGYSLVSVDPVVGKPNGKKPGVLTKAYNPATIDFADLLNEIRNGNVSMEPKCHSQNAALWTAYAARSV